MSEWRELKGEERAAWVRGEFDAIIRINRDGWAIYHDDREMCAICGELPANGLTMLHLCKRCERAVEDERDRGY